MRLYDKALVAKIHANQFTKEVDGIPVLFKPVPDAEPAHLDPRLREIIIKKRTMFGQPRQGRLDPFQRALPPGQGDL